MSSNSSLLQWLATFQFNGQPSIVVDKNVYCNLADGLVCARILNQILPQYFTDEFLNGIEPVSPNGSWKRRVSNIRRILKQISDYNIDLQIPQSRLNVINQPNEMVIAQNFDQDQICRLIQFILFCAITCDNKQYYIEKISNLPTQVQHDIKKAIEEVMIIDHIDNSSNNQLNTSQLINDSVNSESDNSPLNQSHRFVLNSPSQGSIITPVRSSTHRSLRRDSSQNSVDTPRRNESHLDSSSQSNHNFSTDGPEDVKKRLIDALKMKDEKAQACHDLELRLRQLQLEKDQLSYENEKLLGEKMSVGKQISSPLKFLESRRQSQSTVRESGLTIDSRETDDRLTEDGSQSLMMQQNRKLLRDIHKLKEDLIKVETEKEDYRLKSSYLKDDLNRITLRHEELKIKAEQVQRLQDELDELKQISEKVVSYENTIDNLMKKNSELKSKLKSIEEKNVLNIQEIVRLEEENKDLSNTANDVDIYKKQLNEVQEKLSHETHRADKAEVKIMRLKEKKAGLKNENRKLYEMTNQLIRKSGSTKLEDNLNTTPQVAYPRNRSFESVNLEKSTNVHFSSTKTQEVPLSQDQLTEIPQNDDMLNSLSASVVDLRERIARLAHENKLLQNKLASKREQDHALLNNLLESATSKSNRLEEENRQSRKRILLLESHLKDLNKAHNGASTSGAIIHDSSSDNTMALLNRVEELQRSLFQKEQELTDSESKYKKNLQKAKDVIKTLNSNQSINSSLHPSCMSSTSSFNSSSLDEINILKQQLKDKQESLIEMERQFHEYKRVKEVHERLVISAFFGLVSLGYDEVSISSKILIM